MQQFIYQLTNFACTLIFLSFKAALNQNIHKCSFLHTKQKTVFLTSLMVDAEPVKMNESLMRWLINENSQTTLANDNVGLQQETCLTVTFLKTPWTL